MATLSTRIHLANEQHVYDSLQILPKHQLLIPTHQAIYKPFSEVTHAALLHALADQNVSLEVTQIGSLMEAYNSLATFPDVAVALRNIGSDENIEAYVFTNGSKEMVTSSVTKSPAMGPYQNVFKELITVEEVHRFKPDRKVYEYFLRKVGKEDDVSSVWLVTSNPFDVVGAKTAGFNGT